MKANARTDSRIDTLVENVHSYSKPTGRLPTPPIEPGSSDASVEPELAEQTGPDRLRRPEWFEPSDESPMRPENDADDIPAVTRHSFHPNPTFNAQGIAVAPRGTVSLR
jgi:hypothetical protein